jgi:hypothetical protein
MSKILLVHALAVYGQELWEKVVYPYNIKEYGRMHLGLIVSRCDLLMMSMEYCRVKPLLLDLCCPCRYRKSRHLLFFFNVLKSNDVYIYMHSDVHTRGEGLSSNPPSSKKIRKKIVLLLMTCNIFIVLLLHFELKIYNYTNIMIIK